MMKLRIMSDLHLEFYDLKPNTVDSDVVILAGDIHVDTRGVEWALRHFTCPVLYVAGNHEYYGGKLHHTPRRMKELAHETNVHVLENEEIVISGVRFLGGTLWTDYNLMGNAHLAQVVAAKNMNDFRCIKNEDNSKLTPQQIIAHHQNTREFFETKLNEPFDGQTVVITHHAPSEQSVHGRYRCGELYLNASYASNLEHLMGKAVLWVHGHTHDSFDYEIDGTRVVCNPRGYAPSELNYGFDSDLTIEI